MSLIALLIAVLVVCVVLWCVRMLLAAFGVGNPIATVVYVIIVLIALVWLIQALGGGGNLSLGHL